MKKILISLLTIGIIATAGYGVTQALFSDEEVSGVNTFSTGTIDIKVNGQNPWNQTAGYTLSEMKPSYTGYIDFMIKNVGTNPANVWKTLESFAYDDPNDTVSEPECEAEGGGATWDNANPTPCPGRNAENDIDSVINYDMKVELYKPGGTEPVWWETIYLDSDEVKMDTLKDKEMYLGMIPVGWKMKVTQSYHMVSEAGNKYQSDSIDFVINLRAEQLTNTINLENKDNVAFGGYSHTMLGDGTYATLTYKVMDDEFAYDLDVYGTLPDGTYTLIKYDDPLDGSDSWPAPNSLALANVVVSGGTGSVSGSIDLDQNMINAKVWLVKANYTLGSLTGNLTWSPGTTLFETGLIDYYDSN